MSRTRAARAFTRSMPDLIEETIAILRQDASEYAFIGLVGAFAACMAVLVPGIIGGPIAIALIAPVLVVITSITLATSAAALGVGANQLQPDAGRAFGAAADERLRRVGKQHRRGGDPIASRTQSSVLCVAPF